MRIALSLVMLIASATALAGCERESASDSGPPPPPATAPTTRKFSPTTALLAVTQPTTQDAATHSTDPLATPDATVTHMFELMQKQDVTGVRAMMADPLPADKLRQEISAVAERLNSGAKWQIVESRAEGVAAVVIFRTTFADGKQEYTALMLINRYDRWKVMLGQLNLKRFTTSEKEDLNKVLAWAADRMDQLRGVSTTTRATTPATPTTPATGTQ